jgi:hypothetical protein
MIPPQPPDNMGRDASRSFLSGFAGCLGVGLAIITVLIVIVILLAASNSGG